MKDFKISRFRMEFSKVLCDFDSFFICANCESCLYPFGIVMGR